MVATPTVRQAEILRAAAEHPKGYLVGAGTVLRRNLAAAGWAETQQYTYTLPRSGHTLESTVWVITAAGRAVVGAPALSEPGPVDLDAV